MSEDPEMSEEEECPSELKWSPRLPIALDGCRNWSYVDLLESYLESKHIDLPSEASSDSAEHHYPLLLQNINERLEKYGHLAIIADVAMKSKAPEREIPTEEPADPSAPQKRRKKHYMEANEDFYDLSDRFIDDRGIDKLAVNDKEFEEAVEEGFYVLAPSELNKKQRKKKIVPKTSRIKLSGVPKTVNLALNKLKKLYGSAPPTSYLPKGAQSVLTYVRSLLEKHSDTDQSAVLAKIATITGRKDFWKLTDNKLAQEATRQELAQIKKDFANLVRHISDAELSERPALVREIKQYLLRIRAFTDRSQGKKRTKTRNFRAELQGFGEEIEEATSIFTAADIESLSLEPDVKHDLWPNGFEPLLSNEYDSVEHRAEDFD